MALLSVKGKLIGLIGDEDTCVGFLLGGIGDLDKTKIPNLNFVIDNKNSTVQELEDAFKNLVKRGDIDIILITQNIAEMIRHVIDAHKLPIPAVLEIPSKDHPYDPNKDSIMRRAKGLFSAN